MYLIDSCVLVEFLHGRLPGTLEALRSSDPKSFGVPAVVVGELAYGTERSGNPSKSRLAVERLLAPYRVLPFDDRCAWTYGRIRQDLAGKSRVIGPNDLLIAATALANGATLVTRNVREFKRVDGLRVECWDEFEIPDDVPPQA